MKKDLEIRFNAYRSLVPFKDALNEYEIERIQSSTLQRTAN